jgi:putative toxin-antitoxin system antitoxin component (TIGR02293 family)
MGIKVTQLGPGGKDVEVEVLYVRHQGIKAFVDKVRHATPIQLVRTEREGVNGRLVKDLAAEMDIAAARFYSILGVPKATLESKVAKGEVISGAGGQAALSMVRLLGQAEAILERSTSPEAKGFDVAKWLGSWIEQPQPALGGRKPADFLDTPTGYEIVSKALGALESGSYL